MVTNFKSSQVKYIQLPYVWKEKGIRFVPISEITIEELIGEQELQEA